MSSVLLNRCKEKPLFENDRVLRQKDQSEKGNHFDSGQTNNGPLNKFGSENNDNQRNLPPIGKYCGHPIKFNFQKFYRETNNQNRFKNPWAKNDTSQVFNLHQQSNGFFQNIVNNKIDSKSDSTINNNLHTVSNKSQVALPSQLLKDIAYKRETKSLNEQEIKILEHKLYGMDFFIQFFGTLGNA
ncbi:MAG: hypothetical protein AB1782_18115 [Cyanobacteriota bacterium]